MAGIIEYIFDIQLRVVFEVPFQFATSNSRYFPSMTTKIKQYQHYITSASVA